MKSNQVTLTQAATIIRTIGTTNTVLLKGQPGVGKSAILSMLARELPDYLPCYIDCANLDIGDLGMPVIDRESMITRYAPNVRFGIGAGQNRPVLLMADELGKAMKPVLNMLLPVLNERRLADVLLPRGSIVFATTNLDTDGVGDNIPAHAHNRMTVLDTANPSSDDWLMWAADNNVAPEVMLFARDYPQVFQRYDELSPKETNPYIFNPLKGNTKAFCSPRSLERASHIVYQRDTLGAALLPTLVGTIGESAARDLEANIALADALPSVAAIQVAPDKVKLPGSVSAHFLMAYSLASKTKADNLDAFLTYTNRWTSFEASTLYMTTVCGSSNKIGFAAKNRNFVTAAAAVGKYF
jgi:hypothetical protein